MPTAATTEESTATTSPATAKSLPIATRRTRSVTGKSGKNA